VTLKRSIREKWRQCPWPCGWRLSSSSRADTNKASGSVANRMGFSETLADINFTPYPIRRQYSRKTLIVHLCNIALLGTQMRLRLTFSPTPPLQHPLLRVHRRWSIEFPRRIPKWVHYDGGLRQHLCYGRKSSAVPGAWHYGSPDPVFIPLPPERHQPPS
jgi:hypothetical protein